MATIYNELADREAFQEILDANQGVIILKFGADWCSPCKTISPFVHEIIEKLPSNFIVYDLDVDDNFEIYAYLKTKKMVTGIPAFLAYYRENKSFASDESMSGVNKENYELFFKKCIEKAASY